MGFDNYKKMSNPNFFLKKVKLENIEEQDEDEIEEEEEIEEGEIILDPPERYKNEEDEIEEEEIEEEVEISLDPPERIENKDIYEEYDDYNEFNEPKFGFETIPENIENNNIVPVATIENNNTIPVAAIENNFLLNIPLLNLNLKPQEQNHFEELDVFSQNRIWNNLCPYCSFPLKSNLFQTPISHSEYARKDCLKCFKSFVLDLKNTNFIEIPYLSSGDHINNF
jgi:hypothetical protein